MAPYVPATDATTLQVYVTELAPEVGPVVAEQPIPGTPLINHWPAPVGRVPPDGGVTVAVKV